MILFLDFDGVLHPVSREAGTMVFVPNFERVMRDYPEVDIVISSAWRESSSLVELQSHFSQGFKERIIDATPVLQILDHKYLRQAEITAWLRDAGREYESWVAIDDSDWLFPPECRNLILVNGQVGLDMETADRLRRAIKN